MAQLYANAARSTLVASVTSTGNQLQINPSDQAKFPVAAGADFFKVAIEDSSGNIEYVKVQRAVGQSILTVMASGRACEDAANFPARAFIVGSLVELRMTAADLAASLAHPSTSTGAHAATAISVAPTGSIAAGSVQAAMAQLGAISAFSYGPLAAVDGPAWRTAIGAQVAGSYLGSATGVWLTDADGNKRFYFYHHASTYIMGGGATNGFASFVVVRQIDELVMFSVQGDGRLTAHGDAIYSDDIPRLAQTQAIATTAAAGSLGPGQSYQDVTSSRVLGTTYPNNTGRPIVVCATASQGPNSGVQILLEGWVTTGSNTYRVACAKTSDLNGGQFAGYTAGINFVVPHGSTYKIAESSPGYLLINSVYELRS